MISPVLLNETPVKPQTRPLPIILTFADFYLPGYRAGGPIRAISNLVDALSGEFQFEIVTRDRDLGEDEPYHDVLVDEWQSVGSARVRYLSSGNVSFEELLDILAKCKYDAVYLNSFFSGLSIRILILRRLGLIPLLPLILAPRGEFSPGALKFKGLRKQIYIAVAKASELCRNVIWQASSSHEAGDIRNVWKDETRFAARVETTPELLSQRPVEQHLRRTPKTAGILHAAIVLRISNKKNLDGALRLLRGVRGQMTFSIFGPVEDPEHWQACQRLIAGLPPNVRVTYHGAITHERVGEMLASKDIFFFPTFGENFGHAIIEALEVGCPVLISDQTPWRDLEKHGVGWDIPLDRADQFHDVFEKMIAMGEEEHRRLSERAIEYAGTIARDPLIVDSNRQLLLAALKAKAA